MPKRPPVHKPAGSRTLTDRRQDHDRQRGSSAQRGYGGRWQRARLAFLSRAENALCRMCEAEGRTTAAEVVDHIVPHRGDPVLFWDRSNWQPLCAHHHNSTKKAEEMSGRVRGADAEGCPLDPAHPWNTPPGACRFSEGSAISDRRGSQISARANKNLEIES